MITSDYRYTISLCRENGSTLAQVPVDIDWEPAVEWGRLCGVRYGRLSPEGRGLGTTVEPIWHPKAGEPYLKGFGIDVTENGGDMKTELPVSYCIGQVRQIAKHLVEKEILAKDENFLYFVLAHESTHASRANSSTSFAVESVVPSIPLSASTLKPFYQNARITGPDLDDDDIPVFIPRTVLREISQLTKQAGSQETGGVLIGYIHQDQDVPELFLEVTDQIVADHTESTSTKLMFTAQTWSAIQTCLNLRNRKEIILGWWHCHNFMKDVCKDCKKASDQSCKTSALFMSSDDCALHRLCFPRAYSLSLVVADGPCTGLTWALFGWKRGTIYHRGFHVSDPTGIQESHPAVNTCE
jgi:hypothetical protein